MKYMIASVALIMAGSGIAAAQDAKFTVTSSSYADGGVIPKKNAGAAENCGSGGGLSPQVTWSNLPEGAKSVAILILDPDGQKGLGTSHLVAYNIPAEIGALAEGAATQSGEGISVGPNLTGEPVYRGMCAQPTDNPHHYTMTVIATDLEPGALPEGLDRAALMEALQGHALAGQSVVGLYGQ
ncbi:YbhB/YbcL family Raf kinase inhibitor-like protein [Pseudogemmobacter bohemicus]|uniref:YbhB/YbcL family Raf kinase inhibitor-like protein n=1 Tax=Pseudogemmobacter bohemicus TaxID=2250708 RepID=UPI000DD35C60|nr:YbhB/YbcL family Raf kinase inhibitor-like protein [Pseudogemmobacter bohemicus]